MAKRRCAYRTHTTLEYAKRFMVRIGDSTHENLVFLVLRFSCYNMKMNPE